jgi:hypothetical protein
MEFDAIITKLSKIQNGAFIKVRYATTLPVRAASKRAGVTCFKITDATLRKGIGYANQKSVIEKVKRGELTLHHELPWGEWHPDFKGLIIIKDGKNYVRFYPTPNKPKSRFFLNGEEVSYEKLKSSGHIQKSYFNRASDEKPPCFDFKPESILGID